MIILSFSFTHTIRHTHTHTPFDISLRHFCEEMRVREGYRGALMRKAFFIVGLGEGWERVVRIRIKDIHGPTVSEGF